MNKLFINYTCDHVHMHLRFRFVWNTHVGVFYINIAFLVLICEIFFISRVIFFYYPFLYFSLLPSNSVCKQCSTWAVFLFSFLLHLLLTWHSSLTGQIIGSFCKSGSRLHCISHLNDQRCGLACYSSLCLQQFLGGQAIKV